MPRSRRPKKYWTKEETTILKLAVFKYGKKWSIIEKMYPIFKKNNRTQIDIKDKWRNLTRKSRNYGNDAGDTNISKVYRMKSPYIIRSRSLRSARRSPRYSKTSDYTIYSKEGCPYCKNAKELLKKNRKTFKEIKVTNKNITQIYSKIDKKTKNYRYFPIIFKKNKFIGGFEDLKKIKIF
jgi:glutaredoxin 3